MARTLKKAQEDNLIPKHFRDLENMSHIANMLLTGENTSDNPEILEVGKCILEYTGNYKGDDYIKEANSNNKSE